MSKMLKTVKKATLMSVLTAVVLVLGLVIALIFGGNHDVTSGSNQALKVTIDNYAFVNMIDEVEDICEDTFDGLKVKYSRAGEMSGSDSEIVYVFKADADLTSVKKALETKFDEATKAGAALEGTFPIVSVVSEESYGVLPASYIGKAAIACAVFAVLAFVYVSLRYRLAMGVVAAICAIVGGALTAALAVLVRIPLTTSAIYVVAVAALLSVVNTMFTFNKMRANMKSESAAKSNEELVAQSVATKEIATLNGAIGVALVLVGAIASQPVRWFALLALIGVGVAFLVGWLYAPAIYLPVKKQADKNAAKKADYQGAKARKKPVAVPAAETEEPASAEEKTESAQADIQE